VKEEGMKQRVDRVSVQPCGTVVAKNNQLHAARTSYSTRTPRLPPTRSRTHYTFFSIFISSHSFITIVFGRKWMCHKQTHIHDFSLLPILFCTLCTYIVYIHSLSLSSSSSLERWGGYLFAFSCRNDVYSILLLLSHNTKLSPSLLYYRIVINTLYTVGLGRGDKTNLIHFVCNSKS